MTKFDWRPRTIDNGVVQTTTRLPALCSLPTLGNAGCAGCRLRRLCRRPSTWKSRLNGEAPYTRLTTKSIRYTFRNGPSGY